MASTLTEFLNSQEELVREAAEVLPHEFSRCTYSLGPLRQAVYLCKICPEPRGICSACSIACHTDHEQIELFPKRNFRCDCPTSAIAHPCKLHSRLEDVNASNQYNHNFDGLFCRCKEPYDPYKEKEAMIQCLACEDWFHESCCNLREKIPSRGNTPESAQQENGDATNDTVSEASSSGLPPPLISEDDYESFICSDCVLRSQTLRSWAGSPGVIMVIRSSSQHPWQRFEGQLDTPEEKVEVGGSGSPSRLGMKRQSTPSTAVPAAKRPKSSAEVGSSAHTMTCVAPPMNYIGGLGDGAGTADIFLTEGFRERWCRCDSCESDLRDYPYLLKEEETYEPPTDPDSQLSLEELGMRALSRIPRDKAIEGIHAFNEMKDDLVKFLRPFAKDGKVVNESDVRAFFATLTEGRKKD